MLTTDPTFIVLKANHTYTMSQETYNARYTSTPFLEDLKRRKLDITITIPVKNMISIKVTKNSISHLIQREGN